MNNQHITEWITDYVLELLPQDKRQRVAYHIQSCEKCRTQVVAERRIGQRVQDCLTVATRPSPLKLHRRFPALPSLARPRRMAWQMQAACVAFLLISALLAFQMISSPSDGGYSQEQIAMTITVYPSTTEIIPDSAEMSPTPNSTP